jgi:hypothetical protein
MIVEGGIAGDVNHATTSKKSMIVEGGIAGDVNHATTSKKSMIVEGRHRRRRESCDRTQTATA